MVLIFFLQDIVAHCWSFSPLQRPDFSDKGVMGYLEKLQTQMQRSLSSHPRRTPNRSLPLERKYDGLRHTPFSNLHDLAEWNFEFRQIFCQNFVSCQNVLVTLSANLRKAVNCIYFLLLCLIFLLFILNCDCVAQNRYLLYAVCCYNRFLISVWIFVLCSFPRNLLKLSNNLPFFGEFRQP